MSKIWGRFIGLFPHRLPIGKQDLQDFCTSLFAIYDIPDLPSYRNAIATMILHLPATVHKKAPHYFAKSVKKAQANQVAYEIIETLRKEEKLKQEEQSQPSTESTVINAVAGDDQVQNQAV